MSLTKFLKKYHITKDEYFTGYRAKLTNMFLISDIVIKTKNVNLMRSILLDSQEKCMRLYADMIYDLGKIK